MGALLETQRAQRDRRVTTGREIVERLFSDANDVLLDEGRAFARAIFGMLERALPFEHGPAFEIVGGHLREDAAEVHLSVAQRTEAPGAADPRRVSGIDALPSRGTELGILHMEHLDAVLVDVDVLEVVELLEHEVRRVVEDIAGL